jgi:hypothetical protein
MQQRRQRGKQKRHGMQQQKRHVQRNEQLRDREPLI